MTPGTFRIRAATDQDAEFILSLAPRFVAFALPAGRRRRRVLAMLRVDLEHALREAPQADRFFISENQRRTRTGFLHLQVQRDFFSGTRACHVSNLGVTRRHEGAGIGRALLAHAQAWANANDCAWVTLNVLPGNLRAQALYARAGFVPDLLKMAKRVRVA